MRLAIALILVMICSMAYPPASVFAEVRAGLLARAGWDAIRAGRLDDATRAFQEAIAANPREATLYLGSGLAAHLQGREADARQALEEALRLDKGLTPASLLLGDLAYRAGELDRAIRVYEDALAVAPEHPQLRAQLDRWRNEAAVHGGFQQALSPHFTVLFEGPAEQRLAARAIEGLEAAYWRIGTTLVTYPPGVLTVVLYTDEQFRDITRSPAWAGGAFDGKIRVPMRGALDHPGELEKVLAHELTHALVKSLASRGVPTWLDEGLAVMFEAGDLRWAEQSVRRAQALLPLHELQNGFVKLPQDQVLLAYAESGLAVQALLDRGNGLSVAQFIQDLGQGAAFADALERRFFIAYDEFAATWFQRLRATGLAPFRLGPVPLLHEAGGQSPASEGQERRQSP